MSLAPARACSQILELAATRSWCDRAAIGEMAADDLALCVGYGNVDVCTLLRQRARQGKHLNWPCDRDLVFGVGQANPWADQATDTRNDKTATGTIRKDVLVQSLAKIDSWLDSERDERQDECLAEEGLGGAWCRLTFELTGPRRRAP